MDCVLRHVILSNVPNIAHGLSIKGVATDSESSDSVE